MGAGGCDGRLLAESVGFGRALRSAGWPPIWARPSIRPTLGLVDIGERETVRAAGQAVFVRRRDDREVYDRVFARWWRRRGRKRANPDGATVAGEPEDGVEAEDGVGAPAGEAGTLGDDANSIDGIPMPISSDEDDSGEVDAVIAAPTAYSSSELLRHRDFDRMTAAELRDALERLVDLLEPRLELRRTRRYELHHHGRLLAPRRCSDGTSRPAASSPVGLAPPDEAAAPDRRPV
jgi:uncharacterized protein with von Willebrand factor type A (vWA) domain